MRTSSFQLFHSHHSNEKWQQKLDVMGHLPELPDDCIGTKIHKKHLLKSPACIFDTDASKRRPATLPSTAWADAWIHQHCVPAESRKAEEQSYVCWCLLPGVLSSSLAIHHIPACPSWTWLQLEDRACAKGPRWSDSGIGLDRVFQLFSWKGQEMII